MLFHSVLFNFKPDIGEEKKNEVLKHARELLAGIPGVMNLHVGKAIRQKSDYEYGLFMYIDNQEGLQVYREHPNHVKFRDVEFFPFLENYKGLDYED